MLGIFVEPVSITGVLRLLMLLPLALSISVVYKTLHSPQLHDIPLASLKLWITIVFGMLAIGVGLWLIFLLLA